MASSNLSLSAPTRKLLFKLAQQTIHYGAHHGQLFPIELANLPVEIRSPRATFVTLEKQGQLRGCIGSLEPRRPLAEDIAFNAFAAAFRDPRFPPVTPEEVTQLDIHLSILSPLEALRFRSEAELLAQIRVGLDGLVLEERYRRSTFLPAVWEQLPDKRDFLAQLKRKAGLPGEYWSSHIRVYRYTVEVIRPGHKDEPNAASAPDAQA